jgi:hypothetical protein
MHLHVDILLKLDANDKLTTGLSDKRDYMYFSFYIINFPYIPM